MRITSDSPSLQPQRLLAKDLNAMDDPTLLNYIEQLRGSRSMGSPKAVKAAKVEKPPKPPKQPKAAVVKPTLTEEYE